MVYYYLHVMLGLHQHHELHTSSSQQKLMLILPTLDWLVSCSCWVILELVVDTCARSKLFKLHYIQSQLSWVAHLGDLAARGIALAVTFPKKS